MGRILKEIKGLFESYEVMNEMVDKKGIRVEIFEAANKNLLQVRVIERQTYGSKRAADQRNMFCDVKVEGTLVKMVFKFEKVTNEIMKLIKSLVKHDYIIKNIGNQVSITVIEPRLDEVQKLFTALEPHCRRFKDNV
jgi:hypothetical protein